MNRYNHATKLSCKVPVQSVSHNLIKYTHGYLIAASKKSKNTFFRHPKPKTPHAFDATKCGKKRMWRF